MPESSRCVLAQGANGDVSDLHICDGRCQLSETIIPRQSLPGGTPSLFNLGELFRHLVGRSSTTRMTVEFRQHIEDFLKVEAMQEALASHVVLL